MSVVWIRHRAGISMNESDNTHAVISSEHGELITVYLSNNLFEVSG